MADKLQFPNIDALIAQFEGFGTEGVPATVNNNPGNIIAGPFATSHGSTGVKGSFAVFPDIETGALAQDALVQHYANQGLSISDLINKWAPGNATGNTPAGTQSYVDFVSGNLGVPATTPIIAAEKKTPDVPNSGAQSPSWCDALGPFKYGVPMCAAPLAVGAITGKPVPGAPSTSPTVGGLSIGRITAFVLGLIFIAAGLFMFKPVQSIVVNSGKAALA
jgi:hypothetical protein